MLPFLRASVGLATAITEGDHLVVNTGYIERVWKWTGFGLVTTRLRNTLSGRQWGWEKPDRPCDWDLPACGYQEGTLVALTATPGNDEGFSSKHICVTATIEYPAVGLAVRYTVWAYPGAAGLRTQLQVKALSNYMTQLPSTNTGIPTDTWLVRTKPESMKTEGRSGYRSQPIVQSQQPEKQCEIIIDMREEHDVTGLGIVPLSTNRPFGLVQECEIAVSKDGVSWSEPVFAGNINPLQRRGNGFVAYAGFGQPVRARLVSLLIPYTAAPLSKDWGVSAAEIRIYSDQYPPSAPIGLRSETISGAFAECTTVAVGYFGGTQNRNGANTPILHECSRRVSTLSIDNDWANVFCVESDREGLMLVKESHKMVNQPGHDTGQFTISPQELTSTGWGLYPQEITTGCYKHCWANWLIVYSGGEDERQLAIKQFDRLRYPLDANVDLFCQANTWSESGPGHAGNAAETEVLKELASVADLGLDMLVIDHGWEVARGNNGFIPDNGWKPHVDMYPQGWRNVVAKARDLGVRLGLWAVAQAIPLDMLKWNYDQGGFASVKLDFASLNSHDAIRQLMHTVREYITYTGFMSRICWDTTEVAARFGYFFAREYGYLHVMNRKPTKPVSVTYVPWLVLRDHWHLSRYTNVNQYQMICQNIDITNPKVSDAHLHSHQYALAITLMGLPEFLQSTYMYTEDARRQLRPLISLWKKHRERMFRLHVFPIGDEPSNASWSGFQWYAPDEESGYLLVFRELHSPHTQQSIKLRFMQDCQLDLLDLCAGTSDTVQVRPDGSITLTIDQPAGFRFFRHEKR